MAPLIEGTSVAPLPVDATITDCIAPVSSSSPVPGSNDLGPALLTMLPQCKLTDDVKTTLDELNVSDVFVELSTEEDNEHVIDESNWIPFIGSLRFKIHETMLSGALFLHAGVSPITEAESTRNITQDL